MLERESSVLKRSVLRVSNGGQAIWSSRFRDPIVLTSPAGMGGLSPLEFGLRAEDTPGESRQELVEYLLDREQDNWKLESKSLDLLCLATACGGLATQALPPAVHSWVESCPEISALTVAVKITDQLTIPPVKHDQTSPSVT